MDPSRSGSSFVWRHHWPTDIIAALLLEKNPGGSLTNSDLELVALVLYGATLLDVCPGANMAPPRAG